jgi:hypothetical protein
VQQLDWNEDTERQMADLFRRVIADDPYVERPTVAMLLQAALQDAGYWQWGRCFGFFRPEPGSPHLPIGLYRTPVGGTWEPPHRLAGRQLWRPGRDPVLNERNRRELATLLVKAQSEALSKGEAFLGLQTFLGQLASALRASGYWERSGGFGFREHPDTGRIVAVLRVPQDHGRTIKDYATSDDAGHSPGAETWVDLPPRRQLR